VSLQLQLEQPPGSPLEHVVLIHHGRRIGPLMKTSEDPEGLLRWLGWLEQEDGSWDGGELPTSEGQWRQARENWRIRRTWPRCATPHCEVRLYPTQDSPLCDHCAGREIEEAA